MSEESSEVPAFACCSVGIGRWFWVAWESESDARALSPALASGYEASAARAEAKAVERVGPRLKRLPAKWASGYKRRGGVAARVPSTEGEAGGGDATRPRARIGRPGGPSKRDGGATRLAFLYSATGREPPDSLGHVAVARHRIVRQNARKIHVDCDPFDEDEWARRGERGGESSGDAPKTRTLAVDRVTLRNGGAIPLPPCPSRSDLLRQRGGRHPRRGGGPDGEVRLVRHARRAVPLLGGLHQDRLSTAGHRPHTRTPAATPRNSARSSGPIARPSPTSRRPTMRRPPPIPDNREITSGAHGAEENGTDVTRFNRPTLHGAPADD